VLYRLVENFVRVAGRGVMKLLILDRGFVDGKNISRCKEQWGIDVLLPMKKNMDIWTDAWALGQREAWQTERVPTPTPKAAPPGRPESIRRREAKRQKTVQHNQALLPPPDPAGVRVKTELCAINGFTSWSEATVPIHVLLMRETYADGHASQWGLMGTRQILEVRQPKTDYQLRTQIEERHRLLKCFHDLSDFCSRDFNVIAAQAVFILLSYTLRQWQLWKQRQELLAQRTPQEMRRRLNLRKEYIVIYHQNAYTQMPLVTFTREVLELEGEARTKALAKIRQLEQTLLSPLEKLRPP
jgi:hypothetical protein